MDFHIDLRLSLCSEFCIDSNAFCRSKKAGQSRIGLLRDFRYNKSKKDLQPAKGRLYRLVQNTYVNICVLNIQAAKNTVCLHG